MNGANENTAMCRHCLKKSIAAYDFALIEMNLYLDTHPDDGGAMELLNAYRRKREELVDAYESRYGTYVVTPSDVQGERWSWVDDPWPWDFVGKE